MITHEKIVPHPKTLVNCFSKINPILSFFVRNAVKPIKEKAAHKKAAFCLYLYEKLSNNRPIGRLFEQQGFYYFKTFLITQSWNLLGIKLRRIRSGLRLIA